MALFGFFRSPKKAPAKNSAKRFVEMTAGVYNTGVDVYSFPGTADEYFAQVLTRNFPGYEIRRNVSFAELYDPTGAFRSSAVFPTQFHKTINHEMRRNRHPKLSFVIYQNGQPELAILLSNKAEYKDADLQLVVDHMGLALRQKNIAFQRYYREFRNDEAYVRQRIEEDLGL